MTAFKAFRHYYEFETVHSKRCGARARVCSQPHALFNIVELLLLCNATHLLPFLCGFIYEWRCNDFTWSVHCKGVGCAQNEVLLWKRMGSYTKWCSVPQILGWPFFLYILHRRTRARGMHHGCTYGVWAPQIAYRIASLLNSSGWVYVEDIHTETKAEIQCGVYNMCSHWETVRYLLVEMRTPNIKAHKKYNKNAHVQNGKYACICSSFTLSLSLFVAIHVWNAYIFRKIL